MLPPKQIAHSLIFLSALTLSAALPGRNGLQVLYTFSPTSGNVIEDQSGLKPPINLKIADMKGVKQTSGSLEVREATSIRSQEPPQRLIDAIRQSGELSIVTWVRPAATDLKGPARIVTLSSDTSLRNLTLGQDGDRFDLRLRTTATSTNGIPSLQTPGKSLATTLTHLTYTRAADGNAYMYLNGKLVGKQKVAGSTSNWSNTMQLALANELTGDRPWRGTFHKVAIYSRSLPADEITADFEAGAPTAGGKPPSPRLTVSEDLFELQVAPILANHCLECHDAATAKGELDLSTLAAALAGGEDGPALKPGSLKDSPLWQAVAKDEMPKKRPPLTADQKAALQAWIESGAVWTAAAIDPAVYTHESRASVPWVPRLTVDEYIATVQATFGMDIAAAARKQLPRDIRADGFSNTAYNLGVDLEHVAAYAQLATEIATRIDALKFASRFSKQQRLTDDDMRDVIRKMGRWVLRGPLSDAEVVLFRGVSTSVAGAGGNFEEAVRRIVEAMVQSPRFLYRIERQRGEGPAVPLDDYELASRVSYILWGSSPDEALHNAAEKGVLSRSKDLREQVERMLKDPRAEDRAMAFARDWLNLDRLEHIRPDPKRFPNWTPQLGLDMRQETLAFFREVIWTRNRPVTELLNAQFTYATPALARHYGLTPAGTALARYDLSDVAGRGGLLTQGSVLTIGGDNASMVTRGLFVLQDILRGVVKAPPSGVDTTPVPTSPGQSHRVIAQARVDDKSCGGCHSRFEPLAYAFEKYNGIGIHLEKDEYGNQLREDGSILIPGAAQPIRYTTTGELLSLLADSSRVEETLIWKITQFALGRPLTAHDRRQMEQLQKDAHAGGGTYRAIITTLVLSDLVRTTRTVTD